MTLLRVGVIGAGHLGQLHARKLAAMPDVQLVAVVDQDLSRAEQLGQELVTKAARNHLELTGQLDAAIVATPACTHYRIAKDLLDRRIHTLVEKPLTTRLPEADHLVSLAEDRHVILQVGHIERFNSVWERYDRELASPKYIEAKRLGRFTFRAADVGVVMDLMIHDIDLILKLTDSDVTDVDAMGLAVIGRHEDMAMARLKFANGCLAQLQASRLSPECARVINVFSSDGFARLDFHRRQLELIRPQQTVTNRRMNIADLTACQREAMEHRLFETLFPRTIMSIEQDDALAAELRDFVVSAQNLEQPRVSGADARNAIAVAETILEQIALHRWTGSVAGPSGPFASPDPTVFRPRIWHDEDAWQRKAG